MSKEITNNQLAKQVTGLESRLDDVLFCIKQGFDDISTKLAKHDVDFRFVKHELAQVGDTCARLENKMDSELAAHNNSIRTLERHCGI